MFTCHPLLQNPNKVGLVKADKGVSLSLQLEGEAVDEWRRSAAASRCSKVSACSHGYGLMVSIMCNNWNTLQPSVTLDETLLAGYVAVPLLLKA